MIAYVIAKMIAINTYARVNCSNGSIWSIYSYTVTNSKGVMGVTGRDREWQGVTESDEEWQAVTRSNREWQGVTGSDREWQGVTGSDMV